MLCNILASQSTPGVGACQSLMYLLFAELIVQMRRQPFLFQLPPFLPPPSSSCLPSHLHPSSLVSWPPRAPPFPRGRLVAGDWASAITRIHREGVKPSRSAQLQGALPGLRLRVLRFYGNSSLSVSSLVFVFKEVSFHPYPPAHPLLQPCTLEAARHCAQASVCTKLRRVTQGDRKAQLGLTSKLPVLKVLWLVG